MPSKIEPDARQILFIGPMIRALLDGTKTQTRRAVKPQPSYDFGWYPGCGDDGKSLHYANDHHWRNGAPADWCPYGQPGDLLWVRETWGLWANDNLPQPTFYRADYPDPGDAVLPKWRPSIHMPRWASRLTLRITDVRVERVQGISEADAIAEGIDRSGLGNMVAPAAAATLAKGSLAIDRFARLWQSINGPRNIGWYVNPWVWALTFEVIQKNVDQVLTAPRTAP